MSCTSHTSNLRWASHYTRVNPTLQHALQGFAQPFPPAPSLSSCSLVSSQILSLKLQHTCSFLKNFILFFPLFFVSYLCQAASITSFLSHTLNQESVESACLFVCFIYYCISKAGTREQNTEKLKKMLLNELSLPSQVEAKQLPLYSILPLPIQFYLFSFLYFLRNTQSL